METFEPEGALYKTNQQPPKELITLLRGCVIINQLIERKRIRTQMSNIKLKLLKCPNCAYKYEAFFNEFRESHKEQKNIEFCPHTCPH